MTSALLVPPGPGAPLVAGPIPETSLSSRAMLYRLSIGVWSARKHDREASDEIAELHGAQKDAGRYNKLLVPAKALAEIRKIVSAARKEHYFFTLPWSDNSYRILSSAAYMEHTEKMRRHLGLFTPAIQRLEEIFEDIVAQEKIRLGTLFKAEDYPGIRDDGGRVKLLFPEEFRAKYSFETNVVPLPDAGDFRVALGDEEKQRLQRQITASVQASLQVASRELWQRLYAAVTHMSERLKAYKVTEEGVENKFHDTLVTNLVKLVDVLPKLNITNDANLDRLAEQVRASLLVDPKELRKSESIRTDTANAADAIAEQMASYMAGYSVPDAAATSAVA
jgi:hypothetical protein